MNKEKENLKNIFDKAKSFIKNVDEIITEEFKGNDMVEYLRTKAKDVQVQFENVKEKADDLIKNYTTQEVFAEDKDKTLEIKLVLSGLVKENISLEVEDNKLIITIDDKNITKEMRKFWSVSKTNLFYDFTQFEESAIVENTTSVFENGILIITIPKKERSKEKEKLLFNNFFIFHKYF